MHGRRWRSATREIGHSVAAPAVSVRGAAGQRWRRGGLSGSADGGTAALRFAAGVIHTSRLVIPPAGCCRAHGTVPVNGRPPGRAGCADGRRRGVMSTASRIASSLHKAVAFSLFGASLVGSGALLVTFGQSMVRPIDAESRISVHVQHCNCSCSSRGTSPALD